MHKRAAVWRKYKGMEWQRMGGKAIAFFWHSPQAALRVPLLTWQAAGTWLFCFLFHLTSTFLGWLQIKDEDQTKTKAVSKQVSGTNGQLRAQKLDFLLLMLLRRMQKATRASEKDCGLIHLNPPHECRGGSSSCNQGCYLAVWVGGREWG